MNWCYINKMTNGLKIQSINGCCWNSCNVIKGKLGNIAVENYLQFKITLTANTISSAFPWF